MEKLPDVCKDCAEYGSEFCHYCLDEITKDMPEEEKKKFNKALQNIAHSIVSERKE